MAGTATLGGALSVLLLNGFTPALGDQFDILLAETITGSFDSQSLPALLPPFTGGLMMGPPDPGDDLYWELSLLTNQFGSTDVLRLSVLSSNYLLAAPVPIPPAIWMFAGGLIGLFGLARRKG